MSHTITYSVPDVSCGHCATAITGVAQADGRTVVAGAWDGKLHGGWRPHQLRVTAHS